MIVRSLLLIVSTIIVEVIANTSVLERYEERLNSALSHKHGTGPRTVKRYKCVEEYVTYDHHGRTVESHQGTRFTTTVDPPVNVYRTNRDREQVREIRRKPAKKVTIDIKRENEENLIITTPMSSSEQVANTEQTTSNSLKPFDEMNDEEADRIIEEMYLKKKESHTNDVTSVLPLPLSPPSLPQSLPVVPQPPALSVDPTYSTNSRYVDLVRTSTPPQRYNINRKPQKSNSIEPINEEEYPPYYEQHRGVRRRPFEKEYDEYEDFQYYRPLRRELRNHRRRPMLYTDDISADTDLDSRTRNSPRQQMTRDLSPLRSMKRLRHQFPQDRTGSPLPSAPGMPVRQLAANTLFSPLPTPNQSNMMHKFNQNPVPLQSAPTFAPPFAPPPTQNGISQIGGETLKMKPIMQSSPQEMQEANEESCSKIRKLAKNFGIKDVSTWARSNCQFLQMYAPMASCELIFHFIDSCKKKNFF